jgi:hypothetical protein
LKTEVTIKNNFVNIAIDKSLIPVPEKVKHVKVAKEVKVEEKENMTKDS